MRIGRLDHSARTGDGRLLGRQAVVLGKCHVDLDLLTPNTDFVGWLPLRRERHHAQHGDRFVTDASSDSASAKVGVPCRCTPSFVQFERPPSRRDVCRAVGLVRFRRAVVWFGFRFRRARRACAASHRDRDGNPAITQRDTRDAGAAAPT